MQLEQYFSVYLILPVTLGPGVYSASNRYEYQKQKKFWEVEHGLCIRLTTSPPSVSGLFAQCGIVKIFHFYRPPWPLTRMAFLFNFNFILHVQR
jgi:hypothetical protein